MRQLLWVVLVASTALGQGRVTLVDAPLEVRLAMPEVQVQGLQNDFRQALARRGAVLLPTRSNWRAAVTSLRRADCDVRDECLAQLARSAGSLYGLWASVEGDAASTSSTAVGRVVNQDGRLARAQVRVMVPRAGRAAALEALEQLLTRLELDTLPPVLSQQVEPLPLPPVPAPAAMVVTLPPSFAPPPTPPPLPSHVEPLVVTRTVRPARVAAWVTLGAAVGAAGLSLGFGVSAAVQRATLPVDGHFSDSGQVQTQRQVDDALAVSLGAGAGAGALMITSIILFATSGPVAVAAVPSAGGGTVVLSGRF